MNDNLMEQLLNEKENTSLDFKVKQYLFDSSDFVGLGLDLKKNKKEIDEYKGELLKDILAFANSWKRTDAYILIGVEEVKGGRNLPKGVSKHIPDNDLQQFVNSKTQKPITFSYEAFEFDKVQIGVIQIPVQERPLFIKNDYGKLKKDTVYCRSGSSTYEARLEEILRMAKSEYEVKEAILLQPIFDAHAIGHNNSINMTLSNKGETVKNISIEWSSNEKLSRASWAKDEQVEISIYKTVPNQYIFPFSISYEDKLGNRFRKILSYDMENIGLSEIETEELL